MMNSLVYLTRGCPRDCEYCALRDAKGIGKELSVREWKEAFEILHRLGVDFNLILGNETWLLRLNLLTIMEGNKVPYALYTTCPEPLFSRYRELFFNSGIIDNLSCGIDYPITTGLKVDDDSFRKSQDAWKGFVWIKKYHPNVDTQGTITVHKGNLPFVPKLVNDLTTIGVFIGINFIHWNLDGKYDFFPRKEEIEHLIFKPEEYEEVEEVLSSVVRSPGLLQNPEFIKEPTSILLNMGWHCKGNPYGGPTVDADGKLRVCGYRRGTYTPKYSIFDLPEKLDEWQEAVYKDAMECPGCAWSYPWMFHYWQEHNPELGNKVFTQHAGEHIDKSKWSERKIK